MSERAIQLFQPANGQISELIGLLSERGESCLSLACPGREKIGDGTVAACTSHTADRYQRIAEFLGAIGHTRGGPAGAGQRSHRIPRFLRAGGHRPASHAEGGHEEGLHDGEHTAETVDLDGLLERLSASRDAFAVLAEMTDEQLDVVPAAGSFRFCDGQRTLEQVVASLLKHQGHQIDAVRTAVT